MRRIFSILTVAIAALFVTSSCELSGGTDPNPNRANLLLWGKVNDAINQHYTLFQTVAQLSDTLNGKTYANSPYQPCDITEKDGAYTMIYGSPELYSSRHYRIKTNGKRLDEGGEWLIYFRPGPYANFVEVGKAVGIVGETSKFNLSINTSELGGEYGYADCYAAESTMEFAYDDVAERLIVRYNTFQGVAGDRQLSASDSYLIEFEVVEPLVIRTAIEEGKMNILYKDFVENTTRALSVQITNKVVTFI